MSGRTRALRSATHADQSHEIGNRRVEGSSLALCWEVYSMITSDRRMGPGQLAELPSGCAVSASTG